MHQGTRVVFDEMLNAQGVGLILCTSLEHIDFLSDAHQLGMQAIFSTSSTSGGVNLSVQIQQSADGRNWLDKNTSPELSGILHVTPGVGQWSLIGGENWPTLPRLRFVMLVIRIRTQELSSSSFRLQLFVTARSRTRAAAEHVVAPHRLAPVSRREAMGRLLGMRPSTFEEVEMHMRDAQPGEGLGQLANRLSPSARADLERITRSLRNLPPEQKHTALTFTSALASLLMMPPEASENPESAVPSHPSSS